MYDDSSAYYFPWLLPHDSSVRLCDSLSVDPKIPRMDTACTSLGPRGKPLSANCHIFWRIRGLGDALIRRILGGGPCGEGIAGALVGRYCRNPCNDQPEGKPKRVQ